MSMFSRDLRTCVVLSCACASRDCYTWRRVALPRGRKQALRSGRRCYGASVGKAARNGCCCWLLPVLRLLSCYLPVSPAVLYVTWTGILWCCCCDVALTGRNATARRWRPTHAEILHGGDRFIISLASCIRWAQIRTNDTNAGISHVTRRNKTTICSQWLLFWSAKVSWEYIT